MSSFRHAGLRTRVRIRGLSIALPALLLWAVVVPSRAQAAPQLGVAKAVVAGPTNNGDGTYSLTYRIYLENSGSESLLGVQLTEDLEAAFTAATSVGVLSASSPNLTVNPGFDGSNDPSVLAGSDSLEVGGSGVVDVTVTVTPGANLGPYDNSATGSATSSGGSVLSDASTSGSNPDANGNGDPADDNTPTPVSFSETPELGVAKAVVSGPTNNGNGTYSLTYRVRAENSGDVPIHSVQVTDNLAAAFAGATGFNVVAVTASGLASNPLYNGTTNTNLLTGANTLATGASGSVDIQVNVTPGANLGPYGNGATGSATSAGGAALSDASTPGSNPDANGNGDPADDSAPTSVSFSEAPELGVAKAVVTGPTNNGNGTYSLTYRIRIENSGDVPVHSVQVTDNLTATFAGATGFNVVAVTGGGLSANSLFNGTTNTNLLTGANTLATGASGSVDLQVTVTPGANLGPHGNSAAGSATSAGGAALSDVSTAGSNPDTNGNGNPTDDSAPTNVTFSESPEIGVAKRIIAGPTNNGDGTYSLTYRLRVENSGDVPVHSVQIMDDLTATFSGATGFTVDAVTGNGLAPNPLFNGTTDTSLLTGANTLATGASGRVDLQVTVTPGANLGPYGNSATGGATSAGGAALSDVSAVGLFPDANGNGDPTDDSTPTSVSFSEAPELGVAKSVVAGPTNNGNGTYSLTYRIVVANSGDVPVHSVQLTDNLTITFTGATGFSVNTVTGSGLTPNPLYNGTTNASLLTGTNTLATGASGSVDLQVTVTPGANLGPYGNNVTGSATSAGDAALSDVSTSGSNPDTNGNGNPADDSAPTSVTFSEAPRIGVAKAVVSGPTNNGNGTYSLTYRVMVVNSGDAPITGVQVTDNLVTTFAGATGFSVSAVTGSGLATNSFYNGTTNTNLLTGANALATGTSGTVDLQVTVTPGANLGPYGNNATGSATSAGGAALSDVSTAGSNPDTNGNGNPADDSAPTIVTFSESPEAGVAKAIVTGPTNNGNGTYSLTYRVRLENSGDVPINSVQVTDNLAATFAGATGFSVNTVTGTGLTANTLYNGTTNTNLLTGTNTLATGASGTIDLQVTVTPGAKLGPYGNNATGSATSAGGAALSDVSAAGSNPDTNGNGNPSDDSAPTSVTFSEAPRIGVAKAVVSGPTNNGNGTYSLTYRILVANSGDVPIHSVQLTDNLTATFAGATGFSVNTLTSSGLAPNPGYNGTTNTNLLTGANTLATGASGTVDLQVTVTPGANLGPYGNSATGGATSAGGAALFDASTAGSNPDTNGNGNPADDSTQTSVSFIESPRIGVAKAVVSGPTNNGDGTYSLTYRILVANSGDVPVHSVQLTDNLTATFAGATGFSVNTVTGSGLTPNPLYNGTTNTGLLTGTNTLATGANATVDLQVTVTPGAKLGPYGNSATGSATSAGGAALSDASAAGSNPDANGNGNPADDSAPTSVNFSESPRIGVAKAVVSGPTNNGDGTYTLTYRILVANSGDVPVHSVQLTDNLTTTFAGATVFSVNTVTGSGLVPNPLYNGTTNTGLLTGTNTLATGASGTVDLQVTITPGANLGPFGNSAIGSATSAGGAALSDASAAGSNPDTNGNGNPADDSLPTSVSFSESPRIGVAKAAVSDPTNNGDGSYLVTYRILVANSGDVPIHSVQVTDNLAATFAGATNFSVNGVTGSGLSPNPLYNGTTDTNLLAGTNSLATGVIGTVDFQVTVTPGANLGLYDNSAMGSATSSGGSGMADVSTSGSNPDTNGNGDPADDSAPTSVSFSESPWIGVAKAVVSGPTNNGNGTYTLTYRILVANSGDVPIHSVQVTDNLAATFAGATGFSVDAVTGSGLTANTLYNGRTNTSLLTGANSLATGASGTVDLQVTVTPGANLGPYGNSATGSAMSSGGSGLSDVSTSGSNPDANGNSDPADDSTPTSVNFSESPRIGVAKAIVSGPTNNGNGTYSLTYRILVANSGDVPIHSVQTTDNLAATFAGATGFSVDAVTGNGLTPNSGYNGTTNVNLLIGTDLLPIGGSGSVDLRVTMTPDANLGPYANSANGSATSAGGTTLFDVSAAGEIPDANGNGNPGDDSTPTGVSVSELPQIGVAKAIVVGPTNNGNGTYALTYRVLVVNTGDGPVHGVQLADNLAAAFANATGFSVDSVTGSGLTVNTLYNGTTNTNLLTGANTLATGASGSVDLQVTVTPGANLGPYDNSATGSATSAGGAALADASTSGSNPDTNGNGDPSDDSTPTSVSFSESPRIGVAKAVVSGPTNNGNGTYALTYRILVANSGDVPIHNVQVTDNLAFSFAGATGFSVDSVTGLGLTPNPLYDGTTSTNLLTDANTLAVGASGRVDFQVTVTPGANLGPYGNSATGIATSAGGVGLTDVSVDGATPDANGNGDPADDSAPTIVSFSESPEIGVAKAVVTGPTNNGDGTYSLTFRIHVENSGDVPVHEIQLTDNLTAAFAGATGFSVDSVTGSGLTANALYNGATNTNLLAGANSLATGASGTVDLQVTVTPGTILGPYSNQATGTGTSPGGTPVSDVSAAGSNPDANGNGNPTDDTTPTSVTFGELPRLGVAKALLSAPVNNGDGSYTFMYRILLSNGGDVPVGDVQLTDNLATTFASATGFAVDVVTGAGLTANPLYNGTTNLNLLSGTDLLATGANGSVDLQVTVIPGTTLGPYGNSATGNGTSAGGSFVTDISTDGVNPDANGNGDPADDSSPTNVTMSETPRIGVAKSVVQGPTNNGNGTYSFTYRIFVENSGNVPLRDVQVTDDLATTFSGAAGFAVDAVTGIGLSVNPLYNGTIDQSLLLGTDPLPMGASGSIDLRLTVTPGANLGPYANSARGSATSAGGAMLSDESTSGSNPDANGNGNPGDDSAPTSLSFIESPEIGVAKRILSGPTQNGDGTHSLTYRIRIVNSGDVPVHGVQVTDNLGTTFAAAAGFVVDAVTGAGLTTNPLYDGTTNTGLLAGTDVLATGASGSIDLRVTVTPNGNLGPYGNSAIGGATSIGGATLSDASTEGSNPDANGNGNPLDDSTPTSVILGESPEIGVAKAVVSGPTRNANGTYTLTFRVLVVNSGDVPVHGVQLTDNLATTFVDAAGFTVDSVTGSGLTLNPSYNGSSNPNFLTGADVVAIGASGFVDLRVTVTPGGNLGPYDNVALGLATSVLGVSLFDVSTDGSNPDANGNGDPTDDTALTRVIFSELPEIGVAKAVVAGPTQNADGTHTLTYRIRIENSGDVPVHDVQLADNLLATFANETNFRVDAVTGGSLTTNPLYDGQTNLNLLAGTDVLGTGTTRSVNVRVIVTPGTDLGPYSNSAMGSATSLGGAALSDVSANGSNPDTNGNGNPADDSTPTPVTFVESPEIGVAKALISGPVNNGDGTYTVTYRIRLENSGNVPVHDVQLADNLTTTFAAAAGFTVDAVTGIGITANSLFDGGANPNLLAGTDVLAAGTSGAVDLQVTVNAGAILGPYGNIATGSVTSVGGVALSDVSTAGANPDANGNGNPMDDSTPTSVMFGEAPELGIAKLVTAPPLNNGDGTYTLTYRLRVENTGDVSIHDVQVTDNLAATFAGATGIVVDAITGAGLTPNPLYNGTSDSSLLAGSDVLAIGSSGTVDLRVTVTPGANLGPYANSATGSATSAGGATLSDVSAAGSNPDTNGNGNPADDSTPTSVSFSESTEIGVAKAIVTGPVNNGDGTYTLTYRLRIENGGDIPIRDVQLTDNLVATFAGATGFVVNAVTGAGLTPNPLYNGATDSSLLVGADVLAPGGYGSVDLRVTVTPGANLGPYANSATVSATSAGGATLSDVSAAGSNPDANGNGNPADDNTPTSVSFSESAEIGVAKAAISAPTNNGDGTYTLTYRILIANSGDVPVDGVQLTDNLAATFTGAAGFVVDAITGTGLATNNLYDGTTNTNLLVGTDGLAPGGSGSVDLRVTVTPGGNLGPYANSATGSATSAGGAMLNDVSMAGSSPDANGNGNPMDDGTPTSVSFSESAEIGVAKAVTTGPVNNGDGTYTVTYRIRIENSGDVAVHTLQLMDDLSATFAGAASFVVNGVSSADLTLDSAYDGASVVSLLSASNVLGPGVGGTLDVTVTVSPGANLGPYDNHATGTAISAGGASLSDISTNGLVPDANGNGDPADDADATGVFFGENPEIGVAKAVLITPVNHGDGTYTLVYTITVENSGDVALDSLQVYDDCGATFALAQGFIVDGVLSNDFTVDIAYDGVSSTSLLTGTDSLAPGGSGTIAVTVTVTPAARLGSYSNSARGRAVSSGGVAVVDWSTAGFIPDANGDGSPATDSAPTDVTFAADPVIGIAKSVSGTPIDNGDGSYGVTYLVTVENSGDIVLRNVQVMDSLSTTFRAATGFSISNVSSATLTANPGFDGLGDVDLLSGGDTLLPGQKATLALEVTVQPGTVAVPFMNDAVAMGTSPSGITVLDASTAGTEPDANGNGDPRDDSTPTPVNLDSRARIGVAKAVLSGPMSLGDGSYRLTYALRVENLGQSTLRALGLSDDLGVTFAAAQGFVVDAVRSSKFTLNPAYDGRAERELLSASDSLVAGDAGVVEVEMTVSPGTNLGPYDNTAFARCTIPGGAVISDASTDGLVADPNGNGDPSDDQLATRVSFAETARIGLAKAVQHQPEKSVDGTWAVTYLMVVRNMGDVLMRQLQVTDDLAAVYTRGFRIEAISSPEFTVNPSFDGASDRNLLAGTDSLATGQGGTIVLALAITHSGEPDPCLNSAFASARSPSLGVVHDASTAGPNPDPDGNGDPTDNQEPTALTFPLQSAAILLSMSADRRTVEVGNFVRYTLEVENTTAAVVPGVVVRDLVPAGFTYASGSGMLLRADRSPLAFEPRGAETLEFPAFDLGATEKVHIEYLLRTGSGVGLGEHVNRATAYQNDVVVANTATASVERVPDLALERTTLIGKVFHDRNGDGWQGTAAANDVRLRIQFDAGTYVSSSSTIDVGAGPRRLEDIGAGSPFSLPSDVGALPAAASLDDGNPAVVITTAVRGGTLPRIEVTTREGTHLRLASDGTLTTNHTGSKAHGTTGQDLAIVRAVRQDGDVQTLEITIENRGLDEEGLPGVRLATASGLVIETDAHGRYHIADVNAGFSQGRNFILKVDPASLPEGARLTTENPRILHLTAGLMSRIDFGVELDIQEPIESALQRAEARLRFEKSVQPWILEPVWEIDRPETIVLDGDTFQPGRADLTKGAGPSIAKLAERLAQDPDITAAIEAHTDKAPVNSVMFLDNYDLSIARARAIMYELVLKHGIAADRLFPVGMGPDRPVDPGKKAAAQRKNRRIEVKLIPAQTNESRVVGVKPDEVTLRLDVQYRGDLPLEKIEIDDTLPPGMTYVPGSSQIATAAVEPMILESTEGTSLRWKVQAAALESGVSIVYRARVLSIDPSQPLGGEARLHWRTVEGDSGTSSSLRTPLYASEMSPHIDLYTLGHADFATVNAGLSEAGEEALQLVSKLMQEFDRVRIVIDGHTENQPVTVPKFHNNMELSEARAQSVKASLQRLTGLADSVFVVRGYGSTRPVDNNFTPVGRQRNQRVEITLRGWKTPEPVWMRQTPRPATNAAHIEVPILGFRTSAVGKPSAAPGAPRRADASVGGGTQRPSLRLAAAPPAASTSNQPAGRATTSNDARETLTLPWGGSVWMVSDPGTDAPRLDVRGPDILEVEKGFATRFTVSTNYSAFIHAWEIALYRGTDADLTRPVRTLSGRGFKPEQVIEWDGRFDSGAEVATDDDLFYVLRVYDDQSHMDETMPGRIQLVQGSDRAAEAGAQGAPSDDRLRVQSIPVRGGRVRIHGAGIPLDVRVRVADQDIQMDRDGKFTFACLLPSGERELPVAARNASGAAWDGNLRANVKDSAFFMVGIADVSLGDNQVSGDATLTAGDPTLKDTVFGTGRLAFYLKGLWRGKYRATAHLDTQEEEFGEIFGNFDHKDPRSVFRHLDPDRFALTYGDGSITTADVNAQGRLYARLDWDKSQFLWGNYTTGFTGTEFAQYNRSLYGATLRHRSLQVTSQGDSKVEGTAFASEAQTALGHNEFLGTGSSLYYLEHNEVVQGSEKVWVEVRDRDSDRVIENVALVRERDYEIDELQGRILLHRPLMQVADQVAPSIIKDTPLDGNRVLMLVDYEYVPAAFDAGQATAGARGRVWATDGVALGGTYVHENRDSEDYQLAATDVILRRGRGTYLKTEYAQSQANQSGANSYSSDGGFTFEQRINPSAAIEGEALGLEGKLDLAELLQRDGAPQLGAWWKQRDAGFSTARLYTPQQSELYGAELLWRPRPRLALGSRWSETNTDDTRMDRSASLQAEYRFPRWQLGGELRQRQEENGAVTSTDATLGGVRLGFDLRPGINLYSQGQVTLRHDDNEEPNNLGTLGLRSQLGNKLNLRAEATSGNRGNAARFGTDLRIDPRHELFGTYTLSTDRVDGRRGILSLGQRQTLSNQMRVFTDHQFTHGEGPSGSTQAYGMTLEPRKDWSLSASYQSGDLADPAVGLIDRDAVSAELTLQRPKRRLSLKGEVRDDDGAVHRRQWLTANRLDLDLADGWTLLAKASFSRTDDRNANLAEAQFVESGIGLAYRPVRHSRMNMLGRYTFLYGLPAITQSQRSDEKAHVVSVEAGYDLTRRWELGGRLALKSEEIRTVRDGGEWLPSRPKLGVFRARYHLGHALDAVGEYRWLWNQQAGDQRNGALLALYRDLTSSITLGAGFNATSFSADLTELDSDAYGWFIRLIGKQ